MTFWPPLAVHPSSGMPVVTSQHGHCNGMDGVPGPGIAANGRDARLDAAADARSRDLWIVRGVPRGTATALAAAGLRSVGDVRRLNLGTLAEMPGVTPSGLAVLLRIIRKRSKPTGQDGGKPRLPES